MKLKIAALAGALTFLGLPAQAQGNPGKSAMDCVSASREGKDVKFSNSCGHKVFVVWCGDMQYSKSRCGDGPKGNSFYTHSNNISPNSSIYARAIGEYRYAACVGGIAFGKSGIQDRPDGTFACLPSGAAGKAAAAAAAAGAGPDVAAAQPAAPVPQAVAATTPAGRWEVTTDTGEKLVLLLGSDGSADLDGEHPGKWERRGEHVTVRIYVDDDYMRRDETPLVMELAMESERMVGKQLRHVIGQHRVRELQLTLARID